MAVKRGVETRSFLLGAGIASLVAVIAFTLAQDAIIASLGGPKCPPLHLSSQHPSPNSRYLIDPYPINGPIKWSALSPGTQSAFSLGGRVKVVEMYPTYVNETVGPHWTREGVEGMVKAAESGQPNVGQSLSTYGPYTNGIFHDAFKAFSVAGKSVLVLGSRAPWVEAFCIAYGAANITTVDFNKPTTDDPRLTTISIPELDATDAMFDILVSYSSLEHDGLGRYGDPVNPHGDLERMKKIRGLLKSDGLFFLGVPNANDALVFNAHRVYGPIRFPLLIEGWTLLRYAREPIEPERPLSAAGNLPLGCVVNRIVQSTCGGQRFANACLALDLHSCCLFRTFGTPLETLYTRTHVDRWEQPLHVLSLNTV